MARMKRVMAIGAMLVLGWGATALFTASPASAGPRDCSTVRCMACPDGYHFAPTKNNCCRCLPN